MYKSLYRTILLLILCFTGIHAGAQIASSPLEQHIRAVYKLLQERRANNNLQGQGLYDQLKDTAGFQLPVGLGNTSNGHPPVIIDSIRFLADKAEITAYMVVPLPGTDRELIFAGRSIPITRKGGLVGVARLELVNDQPLYPLGDSTALIFKAGKTFVEFDCNGFVRLGMGAEVLLSRKLVKENRDGTPNEAERVRGTFEIVASDLNDIIATINIEPFQVRGVKGVTFTPQDVIIDLSDYKNGLGMVFPDEYSQLYNSADLPLWRGFFLRNMTVTLPAEIKDRSENGRRKSFSVQNALIDENGFSGSVVARYLIPLENGDLGGWSYSVNEVQLGFVTNELKYGRLAGGVNVPITGDTTQFAYTAIFHPGEEYIFTIQPRDNVSFDIFKAANVSLAKSSYLEVSLKEKKFKVAASLTGNLTIAGGMGDGESSKGSKLEMPGLEFEQLVISTEAPFIHSGTFALTGISATPKLGSYNFSIDNIRLVKVDEDRGLGVDLRLNLVGDKNAFAADATIAILGQVKDDNGRYRFRFKRLQLSKIAIDVDQGPFALKGSLEFFNGHQIYGDGFRGDIEARLKMAKESNGLKIAAAALFGNVGGNRYWYADMMVEFPGTVPIFPPVMAKGFGGGLYYGVAALNAGENKKGYELGATPSGVTYKPSPTAGLGLKASMSIALANEKSMNGTVGFEMAFNKSGGVSRIMFSGLCNVMTQPMPGVLGRIQDKYAKVLASMNENVSSELNKSKDAEGQISIDLRVDADFENNTLYANLKAYVNVSGGVLKGIGADGLAGEGVFYAGSDGWYMHLGSPDNPIGVQFLGLARARTYFMVGKDLPGSPPPPQIVRNILKGKDLDYMRDLNALGKGNGMAFGASLDFDTGDMTFLVFYARFAAGLGFDVMLKDYGELAVCEGGNGPLGVNGWYANGQVYGYFQGKIGIKVNLFFKKGKFTILDLGAAVSLQAQLPNPTWMKGTIGGYFSILGGMVSGDCQFEMELGKKCTLLNSNIFAEAGVQVIGDATPGSGEGEVNIFTTPQVVFNMPVGKTFTITGDDNKVHSFRARLDYFNLREKEANVPGTMEWNADNTVVVIKTPDVLTPESSFRMTAKVSFEEQVNGSWTPFLVGGAPYFEEVDHSFTTGKGPEVLPDDRIAYSYPIRKQLNYYKDETRQAYIWLTQGIPYLFNPGSEFKQVVRITPAGGTPMETDFLYSAGKIGFNMPQGMEKDKPYTLQLVNVPLNAPQAVDRNVTSTATSSIAAGDGAVAISTKSADGSISEIKEKVFYEMAFRSSTYSTFGEKIDAAGIGTSYRVPLLTGVHQLGYQIQHKELFDENEIDALGNSKVLRFEAILDDNTWYQQDIYPYLYKYYPSGSISPDRDVNVLGAPPVRAISLLQTPAGLNIQQGTAAQGGWSTFAYDVPYYIYRDYSDVASKIATAMVFNRWTGGNEDQEKILTTVFTPVRKGLYRVRIRYVLPGTDLQTSAKEITINNPLGLE